MNWSYAAARGDSGTSLAYAAMLKPLSVLLCATALLFAACGDDDSQPTEKKETAQAPAAEQKAGCKDVEQPPPRDGRRAEEADRSRSTPARPTRSS